LYGTLQWKKKKKTQKSLMGLHGSQKQNKRKIKKGNKTKERGWRALAATEEDKKKERRKASLTVHGTKTRESRWRKLPVFCDTMARSSSR